VHQPQGNGNGTGTVIAEKGWRSKHFRAFVLRFAILGIVVYFLFLTIRNAWRQVVDSGLELEWGAVDWWAFAWSIPFGMLALLPPCFAWQRIVADFGQKVSWPNSFYAYFLGHFGKYVPGKAMAVVLRVGELHRHGVAARPAIVSVFIETLTGIATGAILGACLIVAVDVPAWVKFAAWACIPFAMLALMPHTFRWVVNRVAKSRIGKMPPKIAEAIDGRMMLRTVFAGLVGWLLQGTALWLILLALGNACESSLQAIGSGGQIPESLRGGVWSIHGWVVCVASVSLGALAGFVSMLPGGAVAREVASTWILATIVPQPIALLATIVMRITSIISEMSMIGIAKCIQWVNRP
jgi:uncharacterized membrane protein YbhN (UPF0104 family)